ncbi:MAG: hypothetical protein IJ348_05660 [Alistipes sp.]|nr:hypothetical protein [Alistipes sp.]
MKQQIDNLIYNALGDGRDVYLPQVGTLLVHRRPATLASSKRATAPYREVTFTGEERGESLVDEIATVGEVTTERAEDIYAQWLQQVRRDDEVHIDGVGVIRQRRFEAEESFVAYLNPQPRRSVALRPRTNIVFYLLATLCILFALGVAGYVLYSEQLFAERMDKSSLVAEVAEVADAPAESPSQQAEAASAEPATTEVAPAPAAVAEPVTEPAPVAEPQTAVSHAVPMKAGYSYAVWGVYSELKNAKYYAALVSERYIDLKPCIYLYKGRYMVAVFERPSRSECAELVGRLKELSTSFRDMWVYTNR